MSPEPHASARVDRLVRLSSIGSVSWLALFALVAVSTLAEEPSQNPQAPSLPASAAAILEKHCVECHGGRLTRSGFDLTTREGLLKGGDSGPVVVPADAKSSRLYELVSHAVEPGMPYKRKKL